MCFFSDTYICESAYVFADPIKTIIVGGDFKVQNSLTLDSLTEREIKRKHHIITAGSMWQKHTRTHTHCRDEKGVVKRGLVEGNYTCDQTTVMKRRG